MPPSPLLDDLVRSLEASLAEGTKANLHNQAKLYFTFMFEHGVDPYSPSSLAVLLYTQFLANSFKSPQSVKNYISGARSFLRTRGYYVPYMYNDRINSVYKGNARLSIHDSKQAPVILMPILKDLSTTLLISGNHMTGERAAFLCMFALALRQCNVTPGGTVGGVHVIRTCDCRLTGSTLWVSLRSSKNITAPGEAVTLPIESTGGRHCPVAAWLHHCGIVERAAHEPAFLLASGHSIAPAYLVKLLRNTLKLIGVKNYYDYTLHSFRRSGAYEAAANGAPVEAVAALGNWRSDSVFDYVPRRVFTSAAATLAKSLAD